MIFSITWQFRFNAFPNKLQKLPTFEWGSSSPPAAILSGPPIQLELKIRQLLFAFLESWYHGNIFAAKWKEMVHASTPGIVVKVSDGRPLGIFHKWTWSRNPPRLHHNTIQTNHPYQANAYNTTYNKTKQNIKHYIKRNIKHKMYTNQLSYEKDRVDAIT